MRSFVKSVKHISCNLPAIRRAEEVHISSKVQETHGRRDALQYMAQPLPTPCRALCGIAWLPPGAMRLCVSRRRGFPQAPLPAVPSICRSLHNSMQPKAIAGYAIAIVNSIGNLGGFIGPFVLGGVLSCDAELRR